MTTPEIYQEAVRDVKLFLEGRPTDLSARCASAWNKPPRPKSIERAAKYRDLISTVEQLQEKQRIAAVEGDDADVFGYHFENGMLAVNLFHMRGGKSARPAGILLGRPARVRRCRHLERTSSADQPSKLGRSARAT